MGLEKPLPRAGGHAAAVQSVYTVFASGGVCASQAAHVTPVGWVPLDSRFKDGSTKKKAIRLWIWV